MREDNGVGVKVEHTFSQEFQSLVEPQTCPAGSEGRHKDVDVGGDGFTVFFLFVVDLDSLFRQGTDITDVVLVAI